MEVVEEPPLLTDVPSSEEVSNLNDKENFNAEGSVQADKVANSNGDAESKPLPEESPSITEESIKEEIIADSISAENNIIIDNGENVPDVPTTTAIDENNVNSANEEKEMVVVESMDVIETQEIETTVGNIETVVEDTVVEVDGVVDSTGDNITFETEVLVESNVTEIEEHLAQQKYDESNNSILNDLDQNIDLSEVLRSSDVSQNVENNNCEQEVFNKEELLDILEGNDNEQAQSRKLVAETFEEGIKKYEEQLALQQLSRLQAKRSKNKKVDKKTTKKRKSEEGSRKEVSKKEDNVSKQDTTKGDSKEDAANDETPKQDVSKEESIVNELVKDWEDDEHTENEVSRKSRKSTEKMPKDQNESVTSNDVSMEDGLNSSNNKSGDDTVPQRRFGRVIKKKVIFDPDNPDTFTKIKTNIKKESPLVEKEQPVPPKKSKSDQTPVRPKSKSPVNKLQWKKPPPKNSKQHKRLTEIDRLLMDEGAVNMICQLTPEAPKGKKNMKSKAEFIKKIQSNTPDTKEMKFRERKKECKTEDGEPKKIGVVKHRLSLSSSVKSPSVCDDFEAHSADDSIIYRRHSSSSYSSSCMSPRRLSDVEANPNQHAPPAVLQNATPESQKAKTSNEFIEIIVPDVFDNTSTPPKEIMNKRDCLSIKEKLNSKLSQVLNKRKRDSIKTEKPSKFKKITSVNENSSFGDNKFVTLTCKDKVAEICIASGSFYNNQMLRELNNVIMHVNSIEHVNVMLFISDTDGSGIDFLSIFKNEKMVDNAREIAEAATFLQSTLAHHNKLTCFGINGRCEGLNMALAALCDISIASEVTSFSLLEHNGILLQPGVAALQQKSLSQNMVNDMVIFGKILSASEAFRSGLVSRVIWPERFAEQVRGIAKDIAAQQPENLRLKKQLLSLKNKSELIASIEKEQEHLVKYWTSAEGLEMMRSNLNSA